MQGKDMGFRFRKSVKLAPGVKLNIGKKSVGISAGNKYGGISCNTSTGAKGRTTLYGTGLSYQWKIGGNAVNDTDTKNEKTLNATTYLILSIFLGMLGVHRFYRNQIGIGILYLFTAGLFGIGWIVDIINAIRLYVYLKI